MTEPQSHPVKAALWMLGAVFSFSSMAVAGREVSFELDTFELMTFRSFIGIAIVLIVGGVSGTLGQITRRQMGLHFTRNIGHFAGQNLWFFALTVIPFAQLFAFEFSVPVWVALFAPLFLAEKLTRTRLLAATLGFVGILIVTRPGSMGINAGIIAAALCAIGFAVSAIFTKLLTRTETITCILFWLTVMQATFGLICAGYDGDIRLPSTATLPWIILIGFAGLFAHFCLTTALKLAPAIIVTPMDFVRLPLIAIVGMLFYNEAIDPMVIVGAVIIFGANFLNISTEARKKP